MKKRIILAVLGLVLLAGCRNKKEKAVPPEVERPLSQQQEEPLPTEDVAPVKVPVKDSGLVVHYDTMPVHDRRKKPAVIYTPEQVVGEWVIGTLHELYNADGTGMAWDLGEDVQAHEAKTFSWTLEENRLTAYYALAVGGVVPQVSYVALVDSVQMVRSNDFGEEFHYRRTPQELTLERNYYVR